MKVQNLNNSSVKTRKLIKDTFIQMVSEKNQMSKITVSELVKRANISRATFYSHFDDIYSVMEEFEEEIIGNFFTNAKLLATNDYEKFFDEMFAFLKQNDENYKMMSRSDDVLFSAKRLAFLAKNKLLEIINNSTKIKNRDYIELDISIFFDGMLFEYVKYLRGHSAVTPEDLHDFSLKWYKRFINERCG